MSVIQKTSNSLHSELYVDLPTVEYCLPSLNGSICQNITQLSSDFFSDFVTLDADLLRYETESAKKWQNFKSFDRKKFSAKLIRDLTENPYLFQFSNSAIIEYFAFLNHELLRAVGKKGGEFREEEQLRFRERTAFSSDSNQDVGKISNEPMQEDELGETSDDMMLQAVHECSRAKNVNFECALKTYMEKQSKQAKSLTKESTDQIHEKEMVKDVKDRMSRQGNYFSCHTLSDKQLLEIAPFAFCPSKMQAIKGELNQFVRKLKKYAHVSNLSPFALAAWVHSEFVRIFPFASGNGKTARFLANGILSRRGINPVEQWQEGYIEAIRMNEKEPGSFTEFLIRNHGKIREKPKNP